VDPSTGASTGRIGAEQALLEAVGALVEREGVQAVAVVAQFPDDSEAELQGVPGGVGRGRAGGRGGRDQPPRGGALWDPGSTRARAAPLPLMESLAPRSAAEEVSLVPPQRQSRLACFPVCDWEGRQLPGAGTSPDLVRVQASSTVTLVALPACSLQTGYTFLPCVLAGLARAPQLVPRSPAQRAPWAARQAQDLALGWAAGAHLHGPSSALWADDVDCVVLPATAFGARVLRLWHGEGRCAPTPSL